MNRSNRHTLSLSISALGSVSVLALSACTHTPSDAPIGRQSLLAESRIGDSVERRVTSASESAPEASSASNVELNQDDRADEFEVPSVSRAPTGTNTEEAAAEVPPFPAAQTVDAVVPALQLPEFLDVVFGSMLGLSYTTGPGVADRTDLIQLRSSGRMDASEFTELVISALETYGLRVYADNGSYRIVTDATLQAQVPRFIRSRSRADIPKELRPVVQFVELEAVSANEMEAILRQAFPDTQILKIETNPRLNVLTLTGLPADLDAAISIIDQLDELAYAGSKAGRYSPVFWPAVRLAQEVAALLEAEGWQASTNKAIQKPILIMPVDYSNDLFIFSRSSAGLARTRFWLNELDRPARRGDEPQAFVVDVRNVDAEILAGVIANVLATRSSPASGLPPSPSASSNQGLVTQPEVSAGSGSIVVNKLSNQLIFTGTPSQYDLIHPLIQRLDVPPSEVMIEVTIAEIQLTEDTRYGVEFFIDSIGNSDFSATVNSEGLGLGGVGANVGVFTGNVEAALNFFAANNLVNVLSTPRLTARSGGAAQIQVGSDVPVITSQRAADTQDGGTTDVLQSVDYRSTGVLLSIEPIVYADNRIDLAITQEVSTAVATTTSQISSPTISNRSVTTQLSLKDGSTAVLAGLIQSTTTRDETGMPLLKDLPLVGSAFRNTTLSDVRTELIVLITAYVIRDEDEKRAFVEELVGRFNTAEDEAQDMSTYRGKRPGP